MTQWHSNYLAEQNYATFQTPEQMLSARIHKKTNSHVLLFSLSWEFNFFVNLVDESYILFWDLKTNVKFFFNKIIRVSFDHPHYIWSIFISSLIILVHNMVDSPYILTKWHKYHVTMGPYHIYLSAKAAWVQWYLGEMRHVFKKCGSNAVWGK